MTTLATLKAALPFCHQLRAIKRAFIPNNGDPDNHQGVLWTAIHLVNQIHKLGWSVSGSTVVEIGSGWFPITPLIFRTAGASGLVTVDKQRLMDRHTFAVSAEYIRSNFQQQLEKEAAPPELFDLRRLPHVHKRSFSQMRNEAGMEYLAPSDFLELGQGIADFIISRSVLEHIEEDTLRRILTHAAQVMKPGGLMCHAIDISDHFEHKNKKLSRVDHLRYSDTAWYKRTTDTGHYHNRLQRFEYLKMFDECGWDVIGYNGAPDAKAMEDLKTMELNPRYANTPHEDLAILVSTIYARRKA